MFRVRVRVRVRFLVLEAGGLWLGSGLGKG